MGRLPSRKPAAKTSTRRSKATTTAIPPTQGAKRGRPRKVQPTPDVTAVVPAEAPAPASVAAVPDSEAPRKRGRPPKARPPVRHKLDRKLVKTLVEAWGPPGYEDDVRNLIKGYVQDLAEEMRVDASGNLLCRIGQGGKRIMIDAHMDEIGLIVHHIDKQGFARFSPLGGLFPTTLNGGRVKLADGRIGAISVEHPYDFTRVNKLVDFFVDFQEGLGSGAGVTVGTPGAMWREYTERGDRMVAKSMDDRIGCVIAIEAMRRLAKQGTPHEVWFVFATQEEVGIRGARTAAFGIDPDYAIALDVTSAGDVPQSERTAVELGKGPAIKVRDAGHIVPPAIKNLLAQRAEENGIPYQFEILDLGSTDASQIQLVKGGVPSGCISIPCRYVHTTSETVDVADVEGCVDLLVAFLSKPLQGLE